MNREERQKLKVMAIPIIMLVAFMSFVIPYAERIARDTLHEVATAPITYAEGVITEKYETSGVLGIKAYSLKIQYGNNHVDIYTTDRDTFLLLEKGQAIKVVLDETDYKISNLIWDDQAFQRYIANRKVTKYDK